MGARRRQQRASASTDAASDATATKEKAAAIRRKKRADEFRLYLNLLKAFLCGVVLVMMSTAAMWYGGKGKYSRLARREAELSEAVRKMEANPELAKAREMLKTQHAIGLGTIRGGMDADDDVIASLESKWIAMDYAERSELWRGTRATLAETDPAFAPLLKADGKKLTDAVVPEIFAVDEFSEDAGRFPRLVRLVLEGKETGGQWRTKDGEDGTDRDRAGRREPTADHIVARDLYRRALLSRFVGAVANALLGGDYVVDVAALARELGRQIPSIRREE